MNKTKALSEKTDKAFLLLKRKDSVRSLRLYRGGRRIKNY
nr:MAG TPA: hypothetical protein [Caudoviricetes sp.]